LGGNLSESCSTSRKADASSGLCRHGAASLSFVFRHCACNTGSTVKPRN
jgi:hypothetical protein